MSGSNRPGGRDETPPTNRTLLVVAGVLLAVPLVGLLWVSSYARETPRLWGFPFFFWYQFLWVFICAAMTYSAHRLVLAARRRPPAPPPAPPGRHQAVVEEEGER